VMEGRERVEEGAESGEREEVGLARRVSEVMDRDMEWGTAQR
jgi:hypothetical protein